MAENKFERELLRSARTHIGKPAIYHQSFAGDCLTKRTSRCFSDGLGRGGFDCSGYADRILADVLGVEVEEVAKKGRHVRDIWDQAEVSERFRRVGIKVGSFLITRRKYEYDDGKKIEVAGHIGLITDVTEETIVWIHASPPIGRVEERQLKTAATIMGAVEYLEAA